MQNTFQCTAHFVFVRPHKMQLTETIAQIEVKSIVSVGHARTLLAIIGSTIAYSIRVTKRNQCGVTVKYFTVYCTWG